MLIKCFQNLAQTPNLENLLQEAINNKDKNEIVQNTLDYESNSSDLSDCDDYAKNDSCNISNKTNRLLISINEVCNMYYEYSI